MYVAVQGVAGYSRCSVTKRRSVRRHTVRHRLARAAASLLQGSMNLCIGGRPASSRSISCSSNAISSSFMGAWLHCSSARAHPIVSRLFSMRSMVVWCSAGRQACSNPMQALSSSMVPYASTRGWSLGTRVPCVSDVVPLSPQPVYIVAFFIPCFVTLAACSAVSSFCCQRGAGPYCRGRMLQLFVGCSRPLATV